MLDSFILTRPAQQPTHSQFLDLLFKENIYWRELWIDYLGLSGQAYDSFCRELQEAQHLRYSYDDVYPFELGVLFPQSSPKYDSLYFRNKVNTVFTAYGGAVIPLIFGSRYMKRWIISKSIDCDKNRIGFSVWSWRRQDLFIDVQICATSKLEDDNWDEKVKLLLQEISEEQKRMCADFTCKKRIRHICKVLLETPLKLPHSLVACVLLYFPNVNIVDASHCVSSRTRLAVKQKKRKYTTPLK